MSKFLKSKFGKIVLVALAVFTLLCLVLAMPFSKAAREKISDMTGKPSEWVDNAIRRGVIVGASLLVGVGGIAVAAFLPVVAVVMVAVAAAAIVYAFWPYLFQSEDTPGSTTIGDEVDGEENE